MKIILTEQQYNRFIKESSDEIDYGLTLTKKGNYFYLILIESDGSIAGYIRMYRNKGKGFSRDTFAAKSGLGKYMLMFNFSAASPNPVTVDRGGGTNSSAYNVIDKFVNSYNIRLEDIPKDSPDYIPNENSEMQKKYLNKYMYGSFSKGTINEFLRNGKILMGRLGISEDDLIKNAEEFFERRYSGQLS